MVSIRNCGLMLEPQEGMRVQEIVDWAKYAERNGYGYMLRSDHLLPIDGRKDQDSPEAWVTLGMLAAETKKIKFGPLVTPIGFRNPALLARMACNVHDYSHGRLVLGIGAGWYKDEYDANGYEFPRFQVRFEQFIEALNIIKPLIEGQPVDLQGKYFKAKTRCYPKSKVHLIIGGRNARIIRAVEKYADEWNITDANVPEIKQLLSQKSAGRKIEVSRMGPFFIAENQRQLQRKLKQKSIFSQNFGTPLTTDTLRKRGVLCGTIDEFTSQVNDLSEAGVQKFYFQILNPKDKEMVKLLTSTLKTL
jgi:alkanesulfonate monooxygenase SsuD/methylene tetrahydromethanopterin reductase-like flavin-dependent oxidoreductase (luciferase family)